MYLKNCALSWSLFKVKVADDFVREIWSTRNMVYAFKDFSYRVTH